MLESQLAALQQDKARLDWLEANANFIEVGHSDIGATRADIAAALASTKEAKP